MKNVTENAYARLSGIAKAAFAANPGAHHIKVRSIFGVFHAARFLFAEELAPEELAWETDLAEALDRVAVAHDEAVNKALEEADFRLRQLMLAEIAAGQPVEVSVKVEESWHPLEE